MSYQLYADSFTTSEFTNGGKTVRFNTSSDTILTVVKTWVCFYGDPTFTNITAGIYQDNSGSKGALLAASTDTWTKAQVLTLDNGINELYFRFNKVSLDASNHYHFVISGAGSSFTTSSHIAWKNSFPYPIYTEGFTQSYRKLPIYPYEISLIGAKF